uniref:Uncharacterized protein n=1 Tax=Anopheles quadriannulatus TaxID=34691 RepID=A0A182XR45_ANOQN
MCVCMYVEKSDRLSRDHFLFARFFSDLRYFAMCVFLCDCARVYVTLVCSQF